MAYQGINTGTTPNDGTGDSLIDGGVKINSNFTEIYNLIGNGSNLAVGVVTVITAGTNVAVNTSTGSVQISAPTPVSIATTDVDISRNLKAVGITTLGVTTTTSFLTSGITTLASQGGITTTGGDFYVGGDLYVLDDIVYDEVTGRNINITGVGTFGQIFVGSSHSVGSLNVSGISTLSGNVSLGASLLLVDDAQILMGDNSEFVILHDDSAGNVIRANTGELNIEGNTVNITSGAGTTQVIATNVDNKFGVELYYNNTKRLETKNGGVRVLGSFNVSGISTLGIVTGATYYGDGSNLTLTGANGSGMTGVVTTLTGADASGVTGITTLIQAGTNISVTTNSGISTISYTGVANTSNINADSLVVSGVSTLGIVTGATYYGDGSEVADVRWDIGANGSSDYTYTGIGFTQTTNDPILYLLKGNVYEFENNSGGGHPFQIRLSNGGSAYSDGVTNNGAASGIIRFEVPFNAPETLYYQCTNHSGMGNTIYTVGRNTNISADSLTISGVSTLGVITATNQYNTGIVTAVGGFVSSASTQGVQITFSGTTLTFTVAGIGSTSLTLS